MKREIYNKIINFFKKSLNLSLVCLRGHSLQKFVKVFYILIKISYEIKKIKGMFFFMDEHQDGLNWPPAITNFIFLYFPAQK